MHHISFLFDGISFDAQSIHNNHCKQSSVPRFPLYMLFSFDMEERQLRLCEILF